MLRIAVLGCGRIGRMHAANIAAHPRAQLATLYDIDRSSADAVAAQPQPSAGAIIEHVFPSSIIDAMARGDVLEIVVFSFIFGTACAAIGVKAKPVVNFCESLAEVMFRYTNYVMYLAPFGVAAAIAVTVGSK